MTGTTSSSHCSTDTSAMGSTCSICAARALGCSACSLPGMRSIPSLAHRARNCISGRPKTRRWGASLPSMRARRAPGARWCRRGRRRSRKRPTSAAGSSRGTWRMRMASRECTSAMAVRSATCRCPAWAGSRASRAKSVPEQVFYSSRDGTRVPMYITHRRAMVKDGNQPLLLYGYGGFDLSLTPTYRPAVQAWLEMGGAYAEANLRGGGEYGETWHRAGTLANKQHVFDDFIAAAQYLISEHYTRSARLGIHGRSNGGLLVGAVLTQRPELFGAALPAVGVLDMLRYHTASANARQWSSDYGLAEDPEQFKALYAYSPVQNVKKGVCYPPTLITTADHDDRVVPWHSYKFAAALQAAQICPNPILIRVETRAGHGAGKPVWMQIDEFADQWAFLAKWLGMSAPGGEPQWCPGSPAVLSPPGGSPGCAGSCDQIPPAAACRAPT